MTIRQLAHAAAWIALGIVIPAAVIEAADLAILGPDNWEQYVPKGKEVDAIYGDLVLRNDKLVAVIAQPLVTRNANMTVKNVGGCLIDFTPRDQQNDQLGAWFPLGKAVNWRSWKTTPEVKQPANRATAGIASVTVGAVVQENKLTAETTYELADGANFLSIVTRLHNLTDEPIEYTPTDEIRADGTVFTKGASGSLTWAYDRWWNAAYGTVTLWTTANSSAVSTPVETNRKVSVPAKGFVQIIRRSYVAHDLNQLQAQARLGDADVKPAVVTIVDEANRPVADAYVEIRQGDKLVTAGKSGTDGKFTAVVSAKSSATVVSPAHHEQKLDVLPAEPTTVRLPTAGTVVAAITDARGGPIPCKVEFQGTGNTKNPYFFDKTGEHAVGNLYYSHTGKFSIDMPPGNYLCIVSHGPEYDIVEQQIEVLGGSETQLAARLVRTVDTSGWVSSDFHNHASPSGDNVSSQYGRVLNLLCEHVEFAPCTEHNRISSYAPHLQRLGVEHLLASCTGIELTSSPLPLGHLNSFPLHMHKHTQDNGAPLPDSDPEVQVERLALWDNRSEKLIQQNHPDLGWLLFDKNGDGTPDEGRPRMLPHLDVIEVHPPQNIFKPAVIKNSKGETSNNTIFNWLQLLNQGARVPGVVNTDAHYNIHGSGWLRNWLESPTDDPGQIKTLDIVHAAEHGHIVMSTGPFLQASVQAEKDGPRSSGTSGDDVEAPGGKITVAVRVQCPNWLDVDRVQIFVNGRADPELNFTRDKHPHMFGQGVVKFDRKIPVALKADAHIIVATIGEQADLGQVFGPEHAKQPPVAVANPIYVDVDGNGFTANKDTLGVPLPVKASASK